MNIHYSFSPKLNISLFQFSVTVNIISLILANKIIPISHYLSHLVLNQVYHRRHKNGRSSSTYTYFMSSKRTKEKSFTFEKRSVEYIFNSKARDNINVVREDGEQRQGHFHCHCREGRTSIKASFIWVTL